MATQGGFGVVFKITISAVLTAVTRIEDIDFPEQEKVLDEFVAHDSPSGYMERIATGVRDLKPFRMTIMWDDTQATHAAVRTAFDSDAALAMTISDPDGQETLAFDGHVNKVGRIAKTKNAYRATVEVSPTGAPTIT